MKMTFPLPSSCGGRLGRARQGKGRRGGAERGGMKEGGEAASREGAAAPLQLHLLVRLTNRNRVCENNNILTQLSRESIWDYKVQVVVVACPVTYNFPPVSLARR